MAVHTHSDGDLAALNVLLFMPNDGTDPAAHIDVYLNGVIADFNIPADNDFHKTLIADGVLIQKAPGLFTPVQDAVNTLVKSINTSASAYLAGVTGAAATVDLIGWGTPGFSIVNQVSYLADVPLGRIPAEEEYKYVDLGALNLVVLRNSPDNGNSSFPDFAAQLKYYYAQAQKMPAADRFRVAMEGINAAYTANSAQFDTAHQAIANLLTEFQTLSAQGVLLWNSCGFTMLTQIDSLANRGLQ